MPHQHDEAEKDLGDKNRGEQMNGNNDKFWKARGHDERPGDWKTRTTGGSGNASPAGG